MRIVTVNLNGIRSAYAKGIWPWLSSLNADVICFQEVRATPGQIPAELLTPTGFHATYLPAEKSGYSGVAVLSRLKPDAIRSGLGWTQFDAEGRLLAIDLGNLTVVSLYLPSGSSGADRQAIKMETLKRLSVLLADYRGSGRDYVICGDINIAHKEIDLKNWQANQGTSGFLPEERAWLSNVFGDLGFTDAFRAVNQSPSQYTWWSNRGGAYANNVGWRIDYQIITAGIEPLATSIYKGEKFSDHAPLILDYLYPRPLPDTKLT